VLAIYLVYQLLGRSSGVVAVILAGYQRTSRVDNLLAAGRVCLVIPSPVLPVGSYPTRFTLIRQMADGLVSVALSLELPLVAVSNCPSLCRPDFPPAKWRVTS